MMESFNNEPVYAVLALLGTTLFLIKTILMLVGGDVDADLDADFDANLDGPGHVDGATSFTIVSVQSVLAFLMGTGWIGLAAREEWDMEKMPAVATAVGVGVVFMMLSAFLQFKMKGLNSKPDNSVDERAIGLTGRAYTDIPKNGAGTGQVEITINGKMQILQASSQDEPIKAFTQVQVTDVDDSGNLTVVTT